MSDAGGDSGGGGGDSGGGGGSNNNYSNDNGNGNRDNGNHDDGWRRNQRQTSGTKCCGVRDWASVPFGIKVLIAFFPLAVGLGAGFGTLADSMMKNSSWITVIGEVIGRRDCICSSGNAMQ